MTLTAMIGALVALLPPALLQPNEDKPKDERLARSHARLLDHIERLERELLIEQHLCSHWKEQAQLIAKQAREEREAFAVERQIRHGYHQQAYQNALLLAQQAYNGLPPGAQAQMQAQAQQQQALAQYAQGQMLAAQNQQAAHWQRFCNCVPSRSQVWAANQGDR